MKMDRQMIYISMGRGRERERERERERFYQGREGGSICEDVKNGTKEADDLNPHIISIQHKTRYQDCCSQNSHIYDHQ